MKFNVEIIWSVRPASCHVRDKYGIHFAYLIQMLKTYLRKSAPNLTRTLEFSFPRKPGLCTNVAGRFPRKLVSVFGKQSGSTRLAGSQYAAVYVLLAVLCGATSYFIGVVFTESPTHGLHQYFKSHATLLGIFGNGTTIGILLLSLPNSLIKRIYGQKYRSTANDILAGILTFVLAAAIAAAAVAMLLILVTGGYSKADLAPLTYSFYRSYFGGGLLIIFGSLAGICVGFVRDRRR